MRTPDLNGLSRPPGVIFLPKVSAASQMDDLANQFEMNTKTLYQSFSSQAALLRAVRLDSFGRVERDFNQPMSQCSTDVLAALPHRLAPMQRHRDEIQPFLVRRAAGDV